MLLPTVLWNVRAAASAIEVFDILIENQYTDIIHRPDPAAESNPPSGPASPAFQAAEQTFGIQNLHDNTGYFVERRRYATARLFLWDLL